MRLDCHKRFILFIGYPIIGIKHTQLGIALYLPSSCLVISFIRDPQQFYYFQQRKYSNTCLQVNSTSSRTPEYTDIHSLWVQIGDQQREFSVLDIYTRLVKEGRQKVTILKITREGVHPRNRHLQGCRTGYKQKS